MAPGFTITAYLLTESFPLFGVRFKTGLHAFQPAGLIDVARGVE
jgi:hypothetical protein